MIKNSWAWGVWGLLLLACGEAPEQDATCAASCNGIVTLSGTSEVPEATALVDAAFCYASGCVTGLLDLREVAETPRCIAADLFGEQASVCAERRGATTLEVAGALSTGPSSEPASGNVFSIVLTDHETGEELLNQRRSAEYTSGESCGLTCWGAEMSF